MASNRDAHDVNYSKCIFILFTNLILETLINNLSRYEDNNLDFYVDSD